MDKSIPAAAAILLDFIGDIEAPRGYNTVYGNNQAKLKKPLTSMTLDEVVRAQPGWTKKFGSSACGRYQFMRNTLDAPNTIEDLRGELDLSGNQLFSADLQDRLGYHLLKRRGYRSFVSGRLTPARFALALAKEWASLPVLEATRGQKRTVQRGQSFYAGDGLNKSLVSPAKVEAILKKALAAAGQSAAPAPDEEPPLTEEPRRPIDAPHDPEPHGPAPEKPRKPLRWSKRFWTWLTTGGAGGLYGMREMGLFELDWTFWLILSGLIVALALIGILTMPEIRAKIAREIG